MKFLEKEIPDYDQLLADPRRTFNADEGSFLLQAKAGKVMAPTGAGHVCQVVTNSKTQNCNYTPPVILFPQERYVMLVWQGSPKLPVLIQAMDGWI